MVDFVAEHVGCNEARILLKNRFQSDIEQILHSSCYADKKIASILK